MRMKSFAWFNFTMDMWLSSGWRQSSDCAVSTLKSLSVGKTSTANVVVLTSWDRQIFEKLFTWNVWLLTRESSPVSFCYPQSVPWKTGWVIFTDQDLSPALLTLIDPGTLQKGSLRRAAWPQERSNIKRSDQEHDGLAQVVLEVHKGLAQEQSPFLGRCIKKGD